MKTFYNLIFDQKNDWDKKLLITNVDRYSLKDIHNKVEEFINFLELQGDLKGKRIAALIPNLTVYFPLLIAVNKLGGTFIPLSHQYRDADLTNVLNLTNPHIVFTIKEHNKISLEGIIKEWAESHSTQLTIFSLVDGSFKKTLIKGNIGHLDVEEIDIIACTSGSTGVPKGIKLMVNSVDHWTHALMDGVEIKETDRLFLTIPLTAPYGICWLLTCFKNRIQMVIPEALDMPVVINLLKEFPCNKIVTTPSIFKAIYMFAKLINPAALNHLELGSLGGEQISEEFVNSMKEFQSCRLKNSYGLSEQGVLMFTNDIRSEVVEWSIINENQYKVIEQSSEEIGELMIKTEYGFNGYYLNDDLTKESLTEDGWFYTGDLVRVDEQGKIEIVGRKKQLIKKGGVQVNPAEVERVLNQHPRVIQSAIVGVPHSVYGEDIVGFVQAEDDLNVDNLFAFLREQLAVYKVPSEIIRIKEMPIIQGKLDKVTLRQIAINGGTEVEK